MKKSPWTIFGGCIGICLGRAVGMLSVAVLSELNSILIGVGITGLCILLGALVDAQVNRNR
jgi:hypothetical protein